MSKRTMAQQFGSEIVDFSCNQMIRDGRFLQGNLVLEFSDGSKARIPASGFYNQNPGTWVMAPRSIRSAARWITGRSSVRSSIGINCRARAFSTIPTWSRNIGRMRNLPTEMQCTLILSLTSVLRQSMTRRSKPSVDLVRLRRLKYHLGSFGSLFLLSLSIRVARSLSSFRAWARANVTASGAFLLRASPSLKHVSHIGPVCRDDGVMTRRWRDGDMRFDADALIPRRAIIPAGQRG